MSAARPPHLISPDDVDAWLADSAVRVVTYHRTTRLGARSILERGIDIRRSRIGAYGQGFYTVTNPDVFHGDAIITTAVRLRNPLVGGFDDLSEYFDRLTARFSPLERLLTPVVASQIRRQLLSDGYDGIVVHDGGGDGIDYVIALVDDVVRVVVSV